MATPNEPVLREGYMVKAPDVAKHLHNFKKWPRKWCRLDASGDLYFYDNEKSHKPSGVLHMMQCHHISDAKQKGVQLSYAVAIEIEGSVHYLKMESASSYNEWIKFLAEFAEVSEVGVVEQLVVDGLGQRASSISSQGRLYSSTTKARFPKKEGWMSKTGSNNKGWNNRYFHLSNGRLSYYKNDKADSSLGSVDLFECQGVKKAAGKKGHGFDILMPGRVYNLSLDSEGEQNDWILALTNTLSTIADIKGSPQPGGSSRRSGSSPSPSGASVDSQELVLDDPAPQPRPPSLHTTETLISESYSPSMERKDKDSVVQLLEAEVEALRGKVSSLEGELQAGSAVSSGLQHKLSESRKAHTSLERQLAVATESHATQVTQLEKQKTEVEAINDSLSTQLEEQIERVQELDEEHEVVRHELEEAQSAATAAEEELTDTQQKLKEIEEVARDLEAALRRRGDSEPQTPVMAHRSLLSRADTAELTSSLDLPARNTQDTFELKQTLDTVERERDKFLQQLTELKMKYASQEKHQRALSHGEADKKLSAAAAAAREEAESRLAAAVAEETLRHQMEMENLRKELEVQREEQGREREGLEGRLEALQEQCSQAEENWAQEVASLERKLLDAQNRIIQLESDLSSQQERVGQLQAQKEKALSDLKAIRKLNRTMEKKISEGEVDTTSPSVSPILEGADYQQRLMEAEQQAEDFKASLAEVEKERDLLKAQLEKLIQGTANGPSNANLSDTSMFRFRSKTSASIASSTMAPSAPSLVGSRTQSFSQSQEQPVAAIAGGPPPKPMRPPKELVNRYHSQQQQQQQQEQRPASQPTTKSRSAASMFQSLFSRQTVKF